MITFLRAITRIILFFSLAWVLVACDSKPAFKNVDITGSKAFGTNFGLIDVDGKLRTLADYQGKAVVMFFGYTHCPDVCPTTLIEMQEAMRLLGPQAAKVQVIFVTLDPERDTSEVLKLYVPAFNPSFIGLRPANEEALNRLTKEFKIYYKRVPGLSPNTYTIDHTAGSYVFDPKGQLRLYIKHGQGPEVLAQDLKTILQ